MKLFSQQIPFFALCAALVLSGCSKKPIRPNPGDTAPLVGPGGMNDGSLTPTAIPGDGIAPLDLGGSQAPGTDLTNRASGLDAANQIRGLLQPVYFDFNQSALKSAERAKLAAAQKQLNDNPEQRLLIEGHCDWRGTAEYNLGLGDRRANAAKQYLQSLGVPATRIEVVSKGDLEAIEKADEATMKKDRRAELVVLKK